MIKIIGMETLLHISFSLAAFVFSVVLYILVCALGSGERQKNLTFRTLVITIVIGDFISILDNIFRDAGIFPTPIWLQLLLLLLVYFANILLTYYMALYMESFFGDFKNRDILFRINTCIMICGVVFSIVAYVRQFILYDGEAVLTTFPISFRVLLGYVFELYFLIYSVALFSIFQKSLSRRAQITSKAAFGVVIGFILIELLNTFGIGSGILYNYFGVVLGLYIFYIGVETPDYRNLLQTLTDLDAAKRSADEANRSKSDFLANMSHEIRTPINAVLGMNEMILREAEDDAILTYSENIGNAGRTLLGLINDILDFSKIEAGKIEIIPVDYDLSICISDLVGMISTRAENKGLLLKLDFDPKIPRFLRGDEIRIRQIITNILTNAVKYTEKGSVSFNMGFERTDDPDSILLNVSVKDTGIGIKSEDLPKLFLEFERIEEKRNRKVEGTGLGMSITKRLLDLMGSTLEVESTYGSGSTFHFSLKQTVTRWEELGDYEASYQEHLNSHKKYKEKFIAPEAKVMVVDDNPMNLMVFKSLVKKTRVEVDTLGSGKEALVSASRNKYDVILLDHMMPEMDGIETLRELKKIKGPNSDTPVICLTANAISGAREKYEHEGFEGYLSKPIDSSELENLLLDHIPEEKIVKSQQEEKIPKSVSGIPDELSSLSGSPIDVAAGLKNSGDRDTYLSLLRIFYNTAEERSEELDRFYSEKNLKEYTILIHALKSSLRIIGATDLGEKAQLLEDAGKAGDTGLIQKKHSDFVREYRGLKEPLRAVFENSAPDNEEKPEAGDEYLKEVYGEIRAAAEDYNTDRLDTIFDVMKKYSIPSGEKERWDQLLSAYERFDYQAVLSLIGQVLPEEDKGDSDTQD